MNKSDLIEVVASQLSSTKTEAGRAVDAVIEAIVEGVQRDQKVTITGFGTFQAKQRAARTGINPATKERITIAPSTTCSFKPAQSLKASLEGRPNAGAPVLA